MQPGTVGYHTDGNARQHVPVRPGGNRAQEKGEITEGEGAEQGTGEK